MTKIITNPIVALVIALLLGVGTGLGMFWKTAVPMIVAAKEARIKAAEAGKPEAPWGFWTIEIENHRYIVVCVQPPLGFLERTLPLRCEAPQDQHHLSGERVDYVPHVFVVEDGMDELGNLEIVDRDGAFVGPSDAKVPLLRSREIDVPRGAAVDKRIG